MQNTLDVLKQGQALRLAADSHLMTALINHLESTDTTALRIPECSSLGCWLQLYRKALSRPNVQAWLTRLPLDLGGLNVQQDTTQLALGAEQVLNFYGYPHPRHHGERRVITQALDQLNTFADPKVGLNDSLKRLNQDLHQLADRLENLVDEDDFNLFSTYKTYLKLESGSFWATTQQTGAVLLTTLTTHADFLALDSAQGLQPGMYAFDPATRRLSGKNALGMLVDIGIEQLLALPPEAQLQQLVDIAEQLRTFVHQSGLFSVAQLLQCHDQPVPDTPEEARALIDTLRQSTALTVLPVADLANADIALMQHLQWLALDHDRALMADALKALVLGKDSDTLIDTAGVPLTPDPDSSARQPDSARHPAVSARSACGPFSLKQLLHHHELDIPDTVAAADDTLLSLHMTLPRPPAFGDYHALLNATARSPVQLDTAQRKTIIETINTGRQNRSPRLLDQLCGALLNGKTPEQIRTQADALLKQLLGLEPARALGQQLITALQWYGQHADESAGQTSLGLLVLSALILDLDPAAGEAGYVLAGFNLVADVHWGKPHADLRRELELHVMRDCKVSTAAAPLAAHLLLAGTAPEFLVQALPDTLRFRTSIAWMTFKQGVMIAHALAPGSPQYMTYNDMIALAAQPPKTVQQQQWRAYTATRTLLDWAIAQGELPERENGEYLTDEIDALKTRLMHRLQALKDALITVASTPPSRRSIALEDLKRVFPKQPWLEKACLWRPVPPLAGSSLRFPMHHHDRENYSLHSLVELHMDGQLDDTRWASIEPQLDLAQLRLSFGQLGDINERFDTAFGAYIATMKQAYSTTIEDLLAQLPLADRSHLQQADLQLLVLKKPPGKDLALLSKEEELARTARTGVILRATSPTGIEEYELFPLLNRVHKRDGPPLAFRLGGTPISATTGGAHSTHPVTQLLVGDELPVDWEAYANGRPPRLGIRSKVIIDLLWSSNPAPDNSLPSTAFTFGSSVNRAIAHAIVQQHFFLEVDGLRVQARGSTRHEHLQQRWDRLLARLKKLVPFWSCATDITSADLRRAIDGAYGCFIDLLALLFPTQQFLTASLAILKKTVPLPIKLIQLGRLSSAFLNTVLNPLDGIPGLFRLAGSGVIRLTTEAGRVLDTAIGQIQRSTANALWLDYPTLLARADIGNGTVLRGSDFVRINALLHKNRWHACSPFSTRPYGPPLDSFRLASAVGVIPMRAANGYRALVTERFFATQPLVIPRSEATDLLHQNQLLRLEHKAATHLDDVQSPAYFRVEKGLDAACLTGRKKRSPIPLVCFTKRLSTSRSSIHHRRVQAIEHIRLTAAPAVGSAPRRLVYDHRLYEAIPSGSTFDLTPVALPPLLKYKPKVTGTLLDDEPQFGLPNDQLDNKLSRETRVVELQALVDGVEDSRVLRAMAVDLNPPGTLPNPRIVVEADTGIFYEVSRSASECNQLYFSQGGEHEQLIRAFSQRKLDYLTAAGYVHNRPLVTLPTLEVLYGQLARRDFSPQKIARLRQQASTLSPLKQRELLLNASDQGQRLPISIAARPMQLESWPRTAFIQAAGSAEKLNQYLAQKAHASTVALVKSTGIGSANVVGTGLDELTRLDIAESLVMWQYSRVGHPNYTEVILKTGAGNCDQMAHVARELIRVNGGHAHIWGMSPPAHAFVVVGAPTAPLTHTLDFKEAGWADLWICDPWAAIVCPARDYMKQLNEKMITWSLQDISVFFNDQGTYRWGQANDQHWLALLNDGLKHPLP